ncbi:hypothetical protein FHS43_001622 [Streptosporangium becharense]|uniref:Uncharacterized protein n=1 Tax=Streptosporangium becharense TaxID=1816182 RepID=A0A7W9ILU6_9ACTN|nr:hypothetical protein [Streptosporangium becharense]MBB2910359.1 hypothetical protein [Streptosporangium becharense]MBB5823102.1 hypothetical protein [Streptosporangium becharense]
MAITWGCGSALVELSVVEQRYRAVSEVEAGCPVTKVIERDGVRGSRCTRGMRRYRGGDLADRTHRPDTCPHQIVDGRDDLLLDGHRSAV